MEGQAHIGLVEVLAGQFLDAIQPVEQGVTVDEEGFGRLADIGMVVEVSGNGLDQVAAVLFVVTGQWANHPPAKVLQGRRIV